MADPLPFSQACENNKGPILEQLTRILSEPAVVLEIGTGTGQHAEHFASRLPHLRWLPTDHPDSLASCQQRLQQAALSNVALPRPLDVADRPWEVGEFDHAYSANTAHIMGWPEVIEMFRGVAEGISPDGRFCLYGPFRYHGEHTSVSNAQFDGHLQTRAAHMGIRDIDEILQLTQEHGLVLEQDLEMPANNRLLVFCRQ